MARTQESVVQELKEKHNNFYTYEEFIFTKVMDKSIVTCPIHGDFEIVVNSHQCGRVCQKCYDERRYRNRLLTQQQFEDNVFKKHGNKYDLSKAVYITQYVNVTVVCKEHGDFDIQPANLMQGRGCQKCGRYKSKNYIRLTLENWKERCSQVHENFYSYHACKEYKNQRSRMKIFCPSHGYFEQGANEHINGRGCAGCALHGYDNTRQSYLYILTSKNLTKLGITNRLPSVRCKIINNSSEKDFIIYSEFYFDKGSNAFQIEQSLLKELRTKYEQPKEKFDGSTECFYDLDPEYLKHLIEQRIRELNILNNEQNTKGCETHQPLETA